MDFLQPAGEDKTLLQVKISPNAKNNAFGAVMGQGRESCLKISIAAQPEKGKANKELVAFLSAKLGLPQAAVEVIKGHTAREKTILLHSPYAKMVALFKSILGLLF